MSPAAKVVIAPQSHADITSKPLIHNADQSYKYDTEKEGRSSSADDASVHEGEEKFKQLGWVKLTVCLIVEAIALGSLSIPSAFAVSITPRDCW